MDNHCSDDEASIVCDGDTPDGVLQEASDPVPLMALTGKCCRWPLGDPLEPGFGFCGAPRERGSYCAEHAERCYQRRKPGTERQGTAPRREGLAA